MKIIGIFLTAVLCLSTISYAQSDAAAGAPGAPAAQKAPVKTIYDYQKELGLTDDQIGDIKGLIANLQKTLGDNIKAQRDLRQALIGMIQNKEEMSAIRKQLRKIADLQVESSYVDIETSRKIETVLTTEQLAKWNDMKKKPVK